VESPGRVGRGRGLKSERPVGVWGDPTLDVSQELCSLTVLYTFTEIYILVHKTNGSAIQSNYLGFSRSSCGWYGI
jgi:hypothetical protein